jgi:hypothetical protein
MGSDKMNQVLMLKEMLQKTQARTTNSFVSWVYIESLKEKALKRVMKKVNFDLNKDPKKLTNIEIEELGKAIQKITGGNFYD